MTRRNHFIVLLLLTISAFLHVDTGWSAGLPPELQDSYGKLPLYFIRNDGQVDEQVKFYEKGIGHATYFTEEGVYLSIVRGESEKGSKYDKTRYPVQKTGIQNQRFGLIKLSLLNANKDPEIIAVDQQEGKVNYLIGNDPKSWKTNIPTYKGVVYKEIYKDIDIRFYGNNRQLEYDVVVKPGADPKDVRFSYDGIKGLRLTEGGDLEVALNEGGAVIQKRPFIFQEIGGKRVEVEGKFVIFPSNSGAERVEEAEENFSYGFEVSSYDKGHPVILDPRLAYSTFWGESEPESGYDIAVDQFGNAVITGDTSDTYFPLVSPIDTTCDGCGRFSTSEAFVIKLHASGVMLYSTYLGGSGSDQGYGVAVDNAGNAYVTGRTTSSNFPGAAGICDGCPTYHAAFIVKLNAAGNAFIYSKYLEGWGASGEDIAVDDSGNAYITGTVYIPTTPGQYDQNAYLQKMDVYGNKLYGYYGLGGTADDWGTAIALDNAGNVYITGYTNSPDFMQEEGCVNPVDGAFAGAHEAFVVKMKPDRSRIYCTYLGGAGDDKGFGIAVDTFGNAYITGVTDSPDFPKASPFDSTLGGRDGFVSKINSDGTSLVYSTYLGGSKDDGGSDIAVDPNGNAHIIGTTDSVDFPLVSPVDDQCENCQYNTTEAFVTKLNASGSNIIFSTYMGGTAMDSGHSIAVDNTGNAYVTGATYSPNFPTANPIDGTYSGWSDMFVAKIEPVINTGVSVANELNPDVAYNATDDQFLTVWEREGYIMGEIRKGDGSIIRDAWVILSGINYPYSNPAVAYTGDGYFVIARKLSLYFDTGCMCLRDKKSIVSAKVSPTGGVSNISQLADDINIFGQPDIIADNKGYSCCSMLAVWDDGAGAIIGQQINGDGSSWTPGQRFIITDVSMSDGLPETPKVAYNGGSDNFIVVYRVATWHGTSYIARRIVRIDVTGQTVSNELILSDPGDAENINPDIDYNFWSNTYLVVWENGSIQGQLLDGSGNKVSGNFVIGYPDCNLGGTCQQPMGDPAVASATDSSHFLVTYYKEPPYSCVAGEICDKNLFGTCIDNIDSTGVVGSSFNIFYDRDLHDQNPALAHGSNSNNYMVTWEHETAVGGSHDIYGKVVAGCETLTVRKTGAGSGTITSNPEGINCGADCAEVYTGNLRMTLSATPDAGSSFTGWSGDDPDCSDGIVTLDREKTCTATFVPGVVDLDRDGVTNDVDCNDNDASVYPGAPEQCDGRDNDCDGQVDEGALNTCGVCGPSPVERCDGLDNDCDGQADEGLSPDTDGDGHYAEGSCLSPADDCNDNDPAIYPGNSEKCDNRDNDCNSTTPDGSQETWYGISCDGPDSDYCKEGTYICDSVLERQACSDNTGNEVCEGDTTRVSVDSSGNEGNGNSDYPSISVDGRYVAFVSGASNLVKRDNNGVDDIFVHDRQTGMTTMVSVDSNGNQGNGSSYSPSISADGRYVVFSSKANNLVSGDNNGREIGDPFGLGSDIFIHDRQTMVTTRVSIDSSGNEGNSFSEHPSISADGRYIAFSSIASNLVEVDNNLRSDIFVHDRQTGVTTKVSVNSSGMEGDHHSDYPSISADGRYVAFRSDASNLVLGDNNGVTDIFVHDRQTGTTTRVSVDSNGHQGNGRSHSPSISADGRYVAFSSKANNLVSGDNNGDEIDEGGTDIFVHDRQTGVTTRVSVNSSGYVGKGGSFSPSISADGRYISFSSLATSLVSGDNNGASAWGSDIFVHDRQTGLTKRVSVHSSGNEGNGDSYHPSISADGRYVAFQSYASNLVERDNNGDYDIFVHNVAIEPETVQSATGAGPVTFSSNAGNLTNLTAVSEGSLPISGKPTGLTFPYGFFSWTIKNLIPGQAVTLTITYPSNIPNPASYWKVINGTWTDVTSLIGDDNGDNLLTLTITDGGLGDADGSVNGQITDPGGVAVAATSPPVVIFSEDFSDTTTSDFWTVYQEGSGPAIAESNGSLEITIPSNSAGATFQAGYISKCQLSGDFNIEVDYQLLAWPAYNGVRIGFSAGGVIERVSWSDIEYGGPMEAYLTHFNDGVQGVTDTGDMSGKLRLTRTGNTLTGYYGSNGEWIRIHSSVYSSIQDVNVTFAVWGHESSFSGQEVRVAFDNLLINRMSRGSLICPSTLPSLTISKTGTGSGTVISSPSGINCGSDCSEYYNQNREVTLTAIPDPGSLFVDWSGQADCSDGVVTILDETNCTATFDVSTPSVIPYQDLTTFITDTNGRVRIINFDNDGIGNLIEASSPGVLASDVDYSQWGISFIGGVIFDQAESGLPATSPPNIISNSGQGTPLVAGNFSTFIHAVGITNTGAEAELRVFDSSGNLLGSIRSDADSITPDFIGLISDTPISSFEYDYVSGEGFGGDDIVISPPPSAGPFEFAVDPNIQPIRDSVTDLLGNVIPLGAVMNPNGGVEQFATNQVIIRPANDEELAAFLTKYNGTLLATDDIPPIPPEVIPPEEVRNISPLGYKLVKVDLATVSIEGFQEEMEQIGASGLFRFSSEDALLLVSLVATERLLGGEIAPNMLTIPQIHDSCVLNQTEEHPFSVEINDALGGNNNGRCDAGETCHNGFLDAFDNANQLENITAVGGNNDGICDPGETCRPNPDDVPWFNPVTDAAIGIGMARAWQYLDYLDLNTPGISLAVIDQGFAIGPGDVSRPDFQVPIVDLNNLVWGNGASAFGRTAPFCDPASPLSCFHGTAVAATAAAGINNRFGTAGTGGQVVSRLLVYHSLPFFFDASVGVTAAIAAGARVINMSFGAPCLFVCTNLGVVMPFLNESLQLAIATGATPVAAAGNDDLSNVDVIDKIPCRLPRPEIQVPNPVFPIPCPFCPATIRILLPIPLPGTICVGAIGNAFQTGGAQISTSAASFSNFGAGVDAWAPGAGVLTVPLPGSVPVGVTNDTGGPFADGTSFSSPFVAGVIAMMQRVNPDLLTPVIGPITIENILRGIITVPGIPSAVNTTSPSAVVSPGFINAFGAVATAAALAGHPPMPDIPDPDGDACFIDNCPNVANHDQADADEDRVGDACDNCRNVPNGPDQIWAWGTGNQTDSDSDGLGDACDNCDHFASPDQRDFDGDRQGNVCDDDDDNDGLTDAEEFIKGTNPLDPDTDDDGLTDGEEVHHYKTNPFKPDTDDDGIGDKPDNCKLISNANQADSDICQPSNDPFDFVPSCTLNSPLPDGVGDACDNCPGVFNPNQTDIDDDTAGDACDDDTDGDGIPDDWNGDGIAGYTPCTDGNTYKCDDNCPRQYNPGQEDDDRDGVGNECDSCPGKVNIGDSDHDRIDDVCDPCPGERFTAYCLYERLQIPNLRIVSPSRRTVECVRSGSDPVACISLDSRPKLPWCPAELSIRESCCPPDAMCPGPGFSVRRLDGSSVSNVSAADLGFTDSDGFGLSGMFLRQDIDGDGIPDYAIGAPFADPEGRVDAGSVALVSGRSGSLIRRLDGIAAGDQFGMAVAKSGDSGRFLVGAPGVNVFGNSDEGSVSLFLSDGTLIRRFDGSIPGEALGDQIAETPDIDGDGSADFMASAPGIDPLTSRGRVVLFSSNGGILGEFVGENVGDGFGLAIASAGDVDHDGLPEFLIGAPFADLVDPEGRVQVDAGRVFLYSSSGALFKRFDGTEAGGQFGSSMSGGGDVDGDGRPDFLVGAPFANPNGLINAGSTFLFSADGTLLNRFDGNSEGDHFGRWVYMGSDLNEDGLADIVVNAPGDQTSDGTSGTSNIFMSISMTADPDGDSYNNQDELIATSDLYNSGSIPGITSIHLHPGFNVVSIPAEMLYSMDTAYKMMPLLGNDQEISRVLHFNKGTARFEEASYQTGNIVIGTDFGNRNGEVQIIYSKVEKVVTFASRVCPTWDLSPGLNLVGSPCATGKTAFQLLRTIGENETVVSSIQRFNPATGQFETAAYQNGQPKGVDFSIKEGEGYFIHMKQAVTGCNPQNYCYGAPE